MDFNSLVKIGYDFETLVKRIAKTNNMSLEEAEEALLIKWSPIQSRGIIAAIVRRKK